MQSAEHQLAGAYFNKIQSWSDQHLELFANVIGLITEVEYNRFILESRAGESVLGQAGASVCFS